MNDLFLNKKEKEQLLTDLIGLLTTKENSSLQIVSPALGKLFEYLDWELPQTVNTTVSCGNEERKYSTKVEVDEEWEEWH